jgi:hypothetical protein
MTVLLNSIGLPKGTGSLQIRGRVYWAIYADERGRRVQANMETDNLDEARRELAARVIKVLQARLAALREVRGETAAGSPRDRPAARDSRSRANGKKPAKAAGAGGTHPRQRGARKGEAA